MSGRLIGWLTLVGVLAAANYGVRASSGKPERNAVYHYSVAVGGIVQYALIALIVLWIAGGSRELLALRRPRSWGRALGLAVLVLIAIYVFGAIVNPYLHPGREQGLTPTGWQSSHAGAFVANFVVIAVAAPIVEELMFRGVGYGLLERYGRWFAIVTVGILFGLEHGLVEALPILAAFGAGLAWIRSRTGSVYPGMLLHGTFNAIALIVSVTT